MEFWGLPSDSGGPEEPESTVFRDALAALQERRYNELGGKWRTRPERTRRAEAGRRARNEMARRIGQHTGRDPLSERTIARRIRRNDPPAGVDKPFLDRWAAIDRAGGVRKLAEQIGVNEGRVRRWRDSPDPEAPLPGRRPPGVPGLPGAPTRRIGIAVDGYVVINAKEYPKRIPWGGQDYDLIDVDPSGELIQAFFDGDNELLKQLLGEEIAMQIVVPTWSNLPRTYRVGYRIETLLDFLLDP